MNAPHDFGKSLVSSREPLLVCHKPRKLFRIPLASATFLSFGVDFECLLDLVHVLLEVLLATCEPVREERLMGDEPR